MALTERTEIDKIEIVGPFKIIQLRHATYIDKDGVQVGDPTYRRVNLTPNSDVSDQPQDIQDLAATVFTQEVKDAYAAQLAASVQP